jgi:hypothetical protein
MILNKKNLKIYGILIILTILLSGCHTDNDDSSSSSSLTVSATIDAPTQISVGDTGELSILLHYSNMLSFPIGTSNDSRTVTITDTVMDGNCHILLPRSPMSIQDLNVDGSTHTIRLIAGSNGCMNSLSFEISGSNDKPENRVIYTQNIGSATANVALQDLSGNIIPGSDQGTQFKIHFSKSNPWNVLQAQKYSVTTNAASVTFSNNATCTLNQATDTCDIIATIPAIQNSGQYNLEIKKENEVDPSSDNIEYHIYGNQWKEISAGGYHSCGIAEDNNTNTTYCWGLNSSGHLGDGNNTDSSIPAAVTIHQKSHMVTG